MKKLSILFLAFLALTSFVSAHAGDDDFGHHSMMMGSWGYGMGIFAFIIYFLVIIVMVLLIIWLVKQIQKK